MQIISGRLPRARARARAGTKVSRAAQLKRELATRQVPHAFRPESREGQRFGPFGRCVVAIHQRQYGAQQRHVHTLRARALP